MFQTDTSSIGHSKDGGTDMAKIMKNPVDIFLFTGFYESGYDRIMSYNTYLYKQIKIPISFDLTTRKYAAVVTDKGCKEGCKGVTEEVGHDGSFTS